MNENRDSIMRMARGAFDHVDGLPGQCCVFFHAFLPSAAFSASLSRFTISAGSRPMSS